MTIPTNTKHPYLDYLNSTIDEQKKLLEKLLLRFTLKKSFKDEYERNEHEILLIKTRGEIAAIKKVIQIKEKHFIEFMQKFVIDIDECEKNFDEVISKAKKSNNATIKELLPKVDWDEVSKDIEAKVKLYQIFRDLLK